MLKAAVAFFSVCACASWVLAAESVRLPLMQEPARAVSGATEFVIAIPRHIDVREGSELTLVLHFHATPSATSEPLSMLVNGRDLQPRFSADTPSFALRIEARVPGSMLQAGWNRIVAVVPRQFGTCDVLRAESHFDLNFERVPLFPELRRFPESVAEERLLRPDEDGALGTARPAVSILLPAKRRDVHLHACAILGARLGQQTYLGDSDVDVVELANWPAVEDRNAIVVGRSDELGNLPLADEVSERLRALGDGHGMLAEFVLGEFPNQRRWILATGADDAGVEKALLTLGSQPALNALAPSPVEITVAPEISARIERLAKPSPSRPTFKDLGWREIEVGRAPEPRFGWRLPPGYALKWGELTLNFYHPKEIGDGSLEVFLGVARVGQIDLTAPNGEGGSVKLSLPEGYRGTDPAMFTFRATTTNSLYRGPIAVVLGNSTFETIIEPAHITGLQHLDTLLVRDSFLRRTTFVLPGNPGLAEMKLLCDLAMNLGRRLPSSPVLWPQACSFDVDRQPAAECVKGRSAVLLAPVSLWRNTVPAGTRLVIEQTGGDTVRFQGRSSKISDYEPTLTFMQMIRAPWSDGEWLITVGGWQDMDLGTMKTLITRGAGEGKIYGNVAAIDHNGRFTAYDSRRPDTQSFPQRLQEAIPAGLTVEQTAQRLSEAGIRRQQSLFVNRLLLWFVGIFIGLIVLGRLLLVWERARNYQRATEQEHSGRTAS